MDHHVHMKVSAREKTLNFQSDLTEGSSSVVLCSADVYAGVMDCSVLYH